MFIYTSPGADMTWHCRGSAWSVAPYLVGPWRFRRFVLSSSAGMPHFDALGRAGTRDVLNIWFISIHLRVIQYGMMSRELIPPSKYWWNMVNIILRLHLIDMNCLNYSPGHIRSQCDKLNNEPSEPSRVFAGIRWDFNHPKLQVLASRKGKSPGRTPGGIVFIYQLNGN